MNIFYEYKGVIAIVIIFVTIIFMVWYSLNKKEDEKDEF
jgi:hypothetical protein